jgi:predicted site-specific integrase-resolvase
MMTHAPASNTSNLVAFDQWLASIGLTRTTGYRYRRQGLLNTVNIFGRLYITREEIARFEQRALNGEFARSVLTPARAA